VNLLNIQTLDELTDEDLDDIQAFKLHVFAQMPRTAFNQMRYAFQHRMQISSLYVICNKLAILSGITPQWYDCCVNSCIAYVNDYEDLGECPECSEPRWISGTHHQRPRRMFCYLPLIPRLQTFFTNPTSREEILYRHQYEPTKNGVSDVFDGQHYKNLCKTWVSIDGKRLAHKFFSNKRDIAFLTSIDSYLLYKHRRRGPSAMPILVQILNLPPDIRTHQNRLICLGIIPGPKGPKHLQTFLYPLENECVELARGVPTQDLVEHITFDLHAYNIFTCGDMIAIEKFLQITGHNGIAPCRSCNVKAINDPSDSGGKTYYIPLMHPGKLQEVNPRDLQLWQRNHEDWANTVLIVQQATTKTDKNRLTSHYGIKGMPALSRVNSLDFARGIPWEFMHLLYENVVKNLIQLWKGNFKGLDEGTQDYVIPDHIWKQIGEETVAAVKDIPSAFVRSLGNIENDQSNYSAEAWAFWFMYLAPFLLQNRLSRGPFRHMCKLVDIMKTCIKFNLQHNEINALEDEIITWVQEYER